MIFLMIIQLFMMGLFFLFGFLILNKKMYGLISGFSNKSEEEQSELISNGFPQTIAKGFINTGWILVIGLILVGFGVPYVIEISWFVMIVYLFGYLLYANKLDLKRVRKRNAFFLSGTLVFTSIILVIVFYAGLSSNTIIFTETEVMIDGSYGVEWDLEEVTSTTLMDDLPNIQMKMNGFSFYDRAKGRFRLDGLGNGLLFVYLDQTPFLLIEQEDDFIIINSKNPQETEEWYEELQVKLHEK
ncbi:DUF3784 domain-containing protein [Salipaludibacillus keqinensis]|nr:DUF3784 domain-containing protein [Salipaludibacillus keqinensis]